MHTSIKMIFNEQKQINKVIKFWVATTIRKVSLCPPFIQFTFKLHPFTSNLFNPDIISLRTQIFIYVFSLSIKQYFLFIFHFSVIFSRLWTQPQHYKHIINNNNNSKKINILSFILHRTTSFFCCWYWDHCIFKKTGKIYKKEVQANFVAAVICLYESLSKQGISRGHHIDR